MQFNSGQGLKMLECLIIAKLDWVDTKASITMEITEFDTYILNCFK